jgi:hypothetical protein
MDIFGTSISEAVTRPEPAPLSYTSYSVPLWFHRAAHHTIARQRKIGREGETASRSAADGRPALADAAQALQPRGGLAPPRGRRLRHAEVRHQRRQVHHRPGPASGASPFQRARRLTSQRIRWQENERRCRATMRPNPAPRSTRISWAVASPGASAPTRPGCVRWRLPPRRSPRSVAPVAPSRGQRG